MPAQKRTSKEKPSVETVKESFKVSDLLRVEVCDPIKVQIDKIKVCVPHIVECVPTRFCKPKLECLPTRICRPVIICKPDIWCKPDIFCYPIIGPQICVPSVHGPIECGPSVYEGPEVPIDEMREVVKELEAIRAEIEILKKSIK
jgi:hypothetical protein